MHFAHRLQYERFELPGLVVHAVPQMLTVEATVEALDEADRSRSLDHTNLLLTHPAHQVGRARPRRHQRDRGRRRAAALRPRAARPLPLPRRGHQGHLVRGLDRHVHLRRQPRGAQGHRRARHRHGRVPSRARRAAGAPSSRSSRSTRSGCRPPRCRRRSSERASGGRAGRGGAPVHRRRRPRGLPPARPARRCARRVRRRCT